MHFPTWLHGSCEWSVFISLGLVFRCFARQTLKCRCCLTGSLARRINSATALYFLLNLPTMLFRSVWSHQHREADIICLSLVFQIFLWNTYHLKSRENNNVNAWNFAKNSWVQLRTLRQRTSWISVGLFHGCFYYEKKIPFLLNSHYLYRYLVWVPHYGQNDEYVWCGQTDIAINHHVLCITWHIP